MKFKKIGVLGAVAAAIAIAATSGWMLQAKESENATVTGSKQALTTQAITVYKNENCSCCASWAEHLEDNGFKVNLVATNAMNAIKREQGVPRSMQSCHTAVMGDLVIEGHVPADDIKAYLENPDPDTHGLSVPGMPHGTPGMDTGREDNYSVLAFGSNGDSHVFKEHKNQ